MTTPRHPKSVVALARQEFRDAADNFFRAVTEPGYSEQFKIEAAWRLARHGLRMRLLEQGRGSQP